MNKVLFYYCLKKKKITIIIIIIIIIFCQIGNLFSKIRQIKELDKYIETEHII